MARWMTSGMWFLLNLDNFDKTRTEEIIPEIEEMNADMVRMASIIS